VGGKGKIIEIRILLAFITFFLARSQKERKGKMRQRQYLER
jgi:hypothetical protein